MSGNFHTHTVFCDGADTAEDMVLAAIDMGMDEIGFSGHAYTPFDTSWCMTPETVERYIGEVRRLAEKYSDKIKVYCGIEADFYSEFDASRFDYVIGSVHYVEKGGVYYPIDESADLIKNAADRAWGGDIYALVEDYYALEARIAEVTGADIIGHFDLITKFNEKQPLFDESDPRYVAAAKAAADALIKSGVPFEINTGAMSRGWRSVPYPSESLMHYIAEHGGEFILSSDSHSKTTLDYGFDEAVRIAERAGVTIESFHYILHKN